MKDIKHQKHLEACKRYRENHREKYLESSLNHAKRKKEANPEEYLRLMRDRAKSYRLNNLEEYKAKEKEQSRIYRLNNREKYLQRQREYRKNNPEKFKEYYEKRKEKQKEYSRIRKIEKYGITEEIYNQMFKNQEGKCAICKTQFKDTPNIDHNHETGKVRGLLCSPCNIVLGHTEKSLKNNPNLFEEITEYLK